MAPRFKDANVEDVASSCKLESGRLDPRGMMILRTNETSLHDRLFESVPGDMNVYVRVFPPQHGNPLPIFLLCGSYGLSESFSPKQLSLDSCLVKELQSQAIRLLGLIEEETRR